MPITLTDEQNNATKKAAEWFGSGAASGKPFGLCGLAGTGKSTITGPAIERMGVNPDRVLFVTPTGKAAKVLTQKLRASGWNKDATTIHKAIYQPNAERADAIVRKIEDVEHEMAQRVEGNSTHFDSYIRNMTDVQLKVYLKELNSSLRDAMSTKDLSFSLKTRTEMMESVALIVVDEASMCGTAIVNDLQSLGIPIMYIGDPGQLPPVSDAWGFDMQNPEVFLNEIHRQALENPIVQLAHMARQGKEIKPHIYNDDVRVLTRRNDDVTMNLDRDAMVLVGTNKKRWDLTNRIRKGLGFTETGPMESEPLIVRRNSRSFPSLVNGSIVTCMRDVGDVNKGDAHIYVSIRDDSVDGHLYDLKCTQGLFEEHIFRAKNAHTAPDKAAYYANKNCEHLDWGHVITVHLSQGSEFDDVVLHDESAIFRESARRWLYTGITRASKKLTIII